MKMKKRRMFIIGFMGCGKSTVGKLLAKKMGLPFYDIDKIIEKKENMSLKEIFSVKGEKYFRDIEYNVLKELCNGKKSVISGGGGCFSSERNRKLIREKCCTVYLNGEFDILKKRVFSNNRRPLVYDENQLLDLYRERIKDFENIDIVIDIEDKSPLEIVSEIVL